jgi:hypothetical protein
MPHRRNFLGRHEGGLITLKATCFGKSVNSVSSLAIRTTQPSPTPASIELAQVTAPLSGARCPRAPSGLMNFAG